MINGKRPWNSDIKARYEVLVANTLEISNNPNTAPTPLRMPATSPYLATKNLYNGGSQLRGAVAHLGERFNGIEEVASSILASSTTILPVEADFQRQLLVS